MSLSYPKLILFVAFLLKKIEKLLYVSPCLFILSLTTKIKLPYFLTEIEMKSLKFSDSCLIISKTLIIFIKIVLFIGLFFYLLIFYAILILTINTLTFIIVIFFNVLLLAKIFLLFFWLLILLILVMNFNLMVFMRYMLKRGERSF